MPTENRSTPEMVSLPEGYMLVERSIWTEQQVDAATACITRLKGVHGMRDRDLAMAAIDAAQCKAPEITLADLLPAQQHQGEPVALPKRKVHYLDPSFLSESDKGWNASLDEIAKLGPLYTHADPAEVERLREGISKHWKVVCDQRAEIERLSRKAANADLALAAQTRQVHTLRAKLAERDALLREWRHGKNMTLRQCASLNERTDSALRERAEPSAPVEIDDQPEFVKTITAKLQRFLDCAEDGQGADIGREWFDVLTKLGLLQRIQRSPAWWEVTKQGDALLARAALERKP